MASTRRGNDHHFLGTYELDDMSLLESGLYNRNKSYDDADRSEAAAAAGKSNIDPRLLMLLKYSRELYVREADLFRKIFPEIQDELAEFFRNFGGVLSQVKIKRRQAKTMQRSLSLGSHRAHGITGGQPPVRPGRFMVRTVVVDDGVGQGQGGGGAQAGQGDTKSA